MGYVVYGTASSGNCHKVRMALDILDQAYEWREIDILKGEAGTPQFLRMNPNGKVPVLQVDATSFLAESNAILFFLGEGSRLVPADRLERARMLQWTFFEQYTHEPAIAVARFIRAFLKRAEDPRLPDLQRRGHAALAVMEQHLAQTPYFAAGVLTLADLALFAYTHKASDGGFDLTHYPAVRGWLARVSAAPGVTAMPSP